ncbi:hypothetical protein GWO60_06575 [Corynebacterium macginleyi]|nr:hypothetical protein [Corynebacterium macginleyi]MBK4174193.1 hypothetical protein [Corynebacterium macginleyi]
MSTFRGQAPDRVGADSLVSRLNNGYRIRIGDFDIRKATAPVDQKESNGLCVGT